METSLCWATRQRSAPQVSLLLRHRADPNAAGRGGMAPLHFAARAGSLEIGKMLVEAGAERGREWRGKTAAALAEPNGHDALASAILRD